MKRRKTSHARILILAGFFASGALILGIASAQDMQEQKLTPIIRSPSSVGEVAFPHQFHFEDLELECQACHHDINAATLRMPHEDYFEDFWIDCRICHKDEGSAVSEPQSCSNCHHDSPTDIADETLSAKVVVHKQCWECHELEKGEEASRGCKVCHLKRTERIP
jgi:hypothetical protein